MQVTEADREFGRDIADVIASLRGQGGDPLSWVSDTVSLKAPPERCAELVTELRQILEPVLEESEEPDDDLRTRCTESYVTWLANL